MALFPCDVCGKRYAGKSNKAYIGWTRGGYSDRKVLNLDAFHIDVLRGSAETQANLLEKDDVVVNPDLGVSKVCQLCTVDPTTTTWWVHLYDRSLGKMVYVTDACDRCTPAYAQGVLASP